MMSLWSPARAAVNRALVDRALFDRGEAHVHMAKFAEAPTTQWLSGRLVLTQTGWMLLEVPNALMRGCLAALNEPGVELPPKANAHISVMTKDEVAGIKGDISERGKEFKYTLGAVKSVNPQGWRDVSKCWFVEVRSPELSALRRSYGLTSLPRGDHPFHITFGIRKKKVLRSGDTTKAAADEHQKTVAVDLDGTILTYDGWKGEDHFGTLRPGVKKVMDGFREKGYRIIINTTRGNNERVGKELDKHAIVYDYINENPDQPEGSSDKLIADAYVDDRAIDGSRSWKWIGQETEKRLEKAASAYVGIPAGALELLGWLHGQEVSL